MLTRSANFKYSKELKWVIRKVSNNVDILRKIPCQNVATKQAHS